VVLLAGEPGIGKTRMMDEFPPPTLSGGVTVLRGGSSQAQGMPPYLPFLEPPSPEPQQLFGALSGNQADTDRFFGTLPVQEFFAPDNLGRIMSGAFAPASMSAWGGTDA
jgi:hypothetical protein